VRHGVDFFAAKATVRYLDRFYLSNYLFGSLKDKPRCGSVDLFAAKPAVRYLYLFYLSIAIYICI